MIKTQSAQEHLILVDEDNNEIGTMEKMEVHHKGLLHRAFSIFIFNDSNEMLLQRRSANKYHSGNLWTNTCCGHPRPNEDTSSAAKRRLSEEMGFTVNIHHAFDFTYSTTFENKLIEHEYDQVFFGQYSKNPVPNPLEVSEWKFIAWKKLILDVNLNPHSYTFWFKICLEKIMQNKHYLPFKI